MNLSFIPGPHMVEGKNLLPKVTTDLPVHIVAHKLKFKKETEKGGGEGKLGRWLHR